jgi:hypothetical protein
MDGGSRVRSPPKPLARIRTAGARLMSPASKRSNVVFPAPLGPARPAPAGAESRSTPQMAPNRPVGPLQSDRLERRPVGRASIRSPARTDRRALPDSRCATGQHFELGFETDVGGSDNDGKCRLDFPKTADELDTVSVGKPHVEYGNVRVSSGPTESLRHRLPRTATYRAAKKPPLVAQANSRLVLDKENRRRAR